MKFFSRMAAVFSAAMIVGNTPMLSSYAIQKTDDFKITGNYTADYSIEQAALEVRNAFKARKTSFSVKVDFAYFDDLSAIANKILKLSVKETGNGTEGDYIRWSLKHCKWSASYNTDETFAVIKFEVNYNSTAEQESLTDNAVNKILSSLSLDGLSDYDKIKKIYGYITKNTTYAENSKEDIKSHTAYAAAVEHCAVCEGYALLLYRLMCEAGVPCRLVYGQGNSEAHAWNIVRLDGSYYYLDSTWDTGVSEDNYHYFLRGSKDFDSLSSINSHTLELDDGTTSPTMEDYKDDFLTRYPIADYAYTPKKTEYKSGDLDGDGMITAADASAILEMYVELSTKKDKSYPSYLMNAADVDGDTLITAADASIVLSYYSYVSTSNANNISLEDFKKKTYTSA